jgi:hypothetical protein
MMGRRLEYEVIFTSYSSLLPIICLLMIIAKNISYNLDVKANARGYEQLATMGLKSTKRLS